MSNYSKPIEYLKKQFNQLAQSNLSKGNELTSKQILSCVQSIYSQITLIQQIMQMKDDENKETNESKNINKYYKENIKNNVTVDDICINLEFAINNCISLYDNLDIELINSILKFIEEAKTDLICLKKKALDESTPIKSCRFTKIHKK